MAVCVIISAGSITLCRLELSQTLKLVFFFVTPEPCMYISLNRNCVSCDDYCCLAVRVFRAVSSSTKNFQLSIHLSDIKRLKFSPDFIYGPFGCL